MIANRKEGARGKESWGPLESNKYATPTNAWVLKATVDALLMRMYKKNSKEARSVHSLVSSLALAEPRLIEDERAAGKIMGVTLQLIASGYRHQKNHWHHTLIAQRNFLNDFLKRQDYPRNRTSQTSRRAWVKKHEKQIVKVLGTVMCGCQYQSGLAPVAEWAQLTAPYASPSELIEEILAHLHGTTSGVVHKGLKPQK